MSKIENASLNVRGLQQQQQKKNDFTNFSQLEIWYYTYSENT